MDSQGMTIDRVMALARHLVSFRDVDALSNVQVAEAKRLFHNLAQCDKDRVKYPKRHKPQLSSGRFGRSKSSVVQGAESVKR